MIKFFECIKSDANTRFILSSCSLTVFVQILEKEGKLILTFFLLKKNPKSFFIE